MSVGPEVFKQKVPCESCPFRIGVPRHAPVMMASYAGYFLERTGATFPCHKSVPKDDDRSGWSPWRDGQVLCAGGLIFAAKLGARNGIVRAGMARGWYDPESHTDADKALVYDTVGDMIGGKHET